MAFRARGERAVTDIERLQADLADFATERGWEGVHTVRNLVAAVGSEVGELQGVVRWLSDEQADEVKVQGSRLRDQFTDEMADVFIFLLRLADVSQVDLVAAAESKIERNHTRFPPAG